MWILYSIIGAFSQAVGSAIKKKSLQTPGMNNVIGFVAFTVAGVIFGVIYFFNSGNLWQENLSIRFWQGMILYAGLNILAVWFMYKALDIAEFNYLMPFMTLTSLSAIIPPIFILGEIPSKLSFVGIIFIVLGSFVINYKFNKTDLVIDDEEKRRRKDNRKGAFYFIVTALCFTITPTATKVAIEESSVLFASFLVHILIGLGFLAMVFVLRENSKIIKIFRKKELRGVLFGIILAGIFIVIENGSINFALNIAPVAYVVSVKRLMPFFAFLIGYFYFKERTNLKKKMIATSLMIIGAIIITTFK